MKQVYRLVIDTGSPDVTFMNDDEGEDEIHIDTTFPSLDKCLLYLSKISITSHKKTNTTEFSSLIKTAVKEVYRKVDDSDKDVLFIFMGTDSCYVQIETLPNLKDKEK